MRAGILQNTQIILLVLLHILLSLILSTLYNVLNCYVWRLCLKHEPEPADSWPYVTTRTCWTFTQSHFWRFLKYLCTWRLLAIDIQARKKSRLEWFSQRRVLTRQWEAHILLHWYFLSRFLKRFVRWCYFGTISGRGVQTQPSQAAI